MNHLAGNTIIQTAYDTYTHQGDTIVPPLGASAHMLYLHKLSNRSICVGLALWIPRLTLVDACKSRIRANQRTPLFP